MSAGLQVNSIPIDDFWDASLNVITQLQILKIETDYSQTSLRIFQTGGS